VNDVREPAHGRPQGGTNWRTWALLVAALLLVIVIAQNSQKVQVDLLFVHTTTPLIFALALAGILGALIGWLAPHVRRGRADR
jgi:uncharacterized integral membrane protein